MQPDLGRNDGYPPRRYDCLIISDLHLGSDVCQAALLERFLEWAVENTRELVINGDIFDDLNFKRLSKRHFACLKVIRRNSDRDDLRLVWVRGNHDGPADVIGHIVGVEVREEYRFENEDVRLLILHGDQFDRFVNNYGLLTEVACGLFYYIQKWAPHHSARYIRRLSKQWQRSSALIRDGAVAYAASKGYRRVACGHTHFPLVEEVDGVLYANSGTWTEHPPCPFISVKGDEIRLEYWPPEEDEAPPAGRADAGTSAPAREVDQLLSSSGTPVR
ncbi:UDP-2,3-diacylglucosamine diphosphatase [Aquisphaera insulae]|uniref:UDP-2,3-diacylglucosamine diphosphatase n=1 Tax=Aquisphaera insulae TaxID=2712864 RepID=UPI0013EDDA0B|nr:UDP-2,3-diacylglucosamine diphosphatase [Aquisphaera insulae]